MNPDIIFENQKLMSQWVNDFGDALYSWAYFKISDEAVARDLVQDTFFSAYQNLGNFRTASSPKTWLFSIMKNKVVDHFRKASKNISLSNDTKDETDIWFGEDDNWKQEYRPGPWVADDSSLLDNPAFNKILSVCMEKLPSTWMACVQMRYLGEKETDDICQQLNITSSNLWQMLHRSKLQLRHCLEENWFKIH